MLGAEQGVRRDARRIVVGESREESRADDAGEGDEPAAARAFAAACDEPAVQVPRGVGATVTVRRGEAHGCIVRPGPATGMGVGLHADLRGRQAAAATVTVVLALRAAP